MSVSNIRRFSAVLSNEEHFVKTCHFIVHFPLCFSKVTKLLLTITPGKLSLELH